MAPESGRARCGDRLNCWRYARMSGSRIFAATWTPVSGSSMRVSSMRSCLHRRGSGAWDCVPASRSCSIPKRCVPPQGKERCCGGENDQLVKDVETLFVYDIAQQWREMTGLPCVLAILEPTAFDSARIHTPDRIPCSIVIHVRARRGSPPWGRRRARRRGARRPRGAAELRHRRSPRRVGAPGRRGSAPAPSRAR